MVKKFAAFILLFSFLTLSLASEERDALNVHLLRGKLSSYYNVWTNQTTWKDGNTGEMISLEDGSHWMIGWWWRKKVGQWEIGDRIALSYHPLSFHEICFKNLEKNEEAWGAIFPQFFDFDHTTTRFAEDLNIEEGHLTLFWPSGFNPRTLKPLGFREQKFEAASKELLKDSNWKGQQAKAFIILGSGNEDFPFWLYDIFPSFEVRYLLVRPIEESETSGEHDAT